LLYTVLSFRGELSAFVQSASAIQFNFDLMLMKTWSATNLYALWIIAHTTMTKGKNAIWVLI